MNTTGGEQKEHRVKTRREPPSEVSARSVTTNRLPASRGLVREPDDEASDLDVPCTD